MTVKIKYGPHAGKIGELTGVYWAANVCTVKIDGMSEENFDIENVKKMGE